MKMKKLLYFRLLWGYLIIYLIKLRATPKIDSLALTAILPISRALMSEIFKSDLIEVGAVARSNASATLSDVLIVEVRTTEKTVLRQKR